MPDATRSHIVLAAAVIVAALVGALVPRRLLVRLLDRGDADRNMGRLSGRFLGLTVVAVGVVYALGVAQADPDRT